jgi:hypothetical protein
MSHDVYIHHPVDSLGNRLPDSSAANWLTIYQRSTSAPATAAQAQLFIGKQPASGSPYLYVDGVQLL